MKKLLLIITLTLTAAALGGYPSAAAAAKDAETRPLRIVIVTAIAPTEEITAKTLERIYLKRKTLWKSGEKIVPINLSASDPLRAVFTKKILRRNHRALVEYWNGKHFSGINPPVVLRSEEAVKRFLRKVPGSIGYISAESVETDLTVIHTLKD